MKKITIVNYGVGNVLSISRAIDEIGHKAKVSKSKSELINSDLIILPGVGAFDNAMQLLKEHNLIDTLKEYALIKEKPVIGICLGMQMLLTKSYEMGTHLGLDFIAGDVIGIKRLSKKKGLKVPHISWSEILKNNGKEQFISEKLINKSFYFVHSYASLTKDTSHTLAVTNYFDIKIPAIIKKRNIVGFQFHPEKSGINGLNLLSDTIKNI